MFVDFWKPDCQPCRTMDGIVDELAEREARSDESLKYPPVGGRFI